MKLIVIFSLIDLEDFLVKLSAATLFKEFIRRLSSEDGITTSASIYYLKAILEACGICILDKRMVHQLAFAISHLVNPSSDFFIVQTGQVFKEAVSIFKEALKLPVTKLSAVLICIRRAMIRLLDFGTAIKELSELSIAIETLAIEILVNINKSEGIEIKIDILEEIIKTLTEVFKKLSKEDSKRINYYVESKQLAEIISTVIKYNAPGEVVQSLLSCNALNKKINNLRTRGLSFMNRIIAFALKKKYFRNIEYPYLSICKEVFPGILSTLYTITNQEHDKLDLTINDKETSKSIVEFLKTLSIMIEDIRFYDLFAEHKYKIVLDICLMLIRITDSERKLIKENPKEFVNLALDTCESQISKIPKTEAAKLLETLCDHIDGTKTFCFRFCCKVIKYCLQDWDLTKAKTNIDEFIDTSTFFMKSNKEELLETSIMALTILSYVTNDRNDVLKIVDKTFTENFSSLFGNPSNLILCRIALMMGYYGGYLFESNLELLVKMIEMLIRGLSLESEEMAFSLQCADALMGTIDYEAMVERIKGVIMNFFPYLGPIISKTESIVAFNFISIVIDTYKDHIDVKIISLVRSLVVRIKTEQELFKHKGKKDLAILNQCWNVIESICGFTLHRKEYKDKIEEELLPLFEYLANPMEIAFEDKLLQTLALLIKTQRHLTDNMLKIFPYLVRILEKYNGVLDDLLEVLNYYLFYGKEVFASNKEWLEIILTMGHVAMNNKQQPIETNSIEGAVLFQILLQTVCNGVLNSYIPVIIDITLKRLEEQPMIDYLRLQLLNVVLCAICNNGALTLKHLGERTEGVISLILTISSSYDQLYDKKVLVIGLANTILNGSVVRLPDKYYTSILKTIVHTLKKAEPSIKESSASDLKEILEGDQAKESKVNRENSKKKSIKSDEEYVNPLRSVSLILT